MIALLQLWLWLSWRQFRGGLVRLGRRDGLEWVRRLAPPVLTAVVALVSAGFAALIGAGGFRAGRTLARFGPEVEDIVGLVRLVPAMFVLGAIGVAVFRGLARRDIDLAPLRLLPLRARDQATLVILGRVIDPWLLTVAGFTFGVSAGLLAGGAVRAATISALAATALWIGLAALLTLLDGFLAALVTTRSRRDLGLALFLVALALAPLRLLASPSVRSAGEQALALAPSEVWAEPVRAMLSGDAARALRLVGVDGLAASVLLALALAAVARREARTFEASPFRPRRRRSRPISGLFHAGWLSAWRTTAVRMALLAQPAILVAGVAVLVRLAPHRSSSLSDPLLVLGAAVALASALAPSANLWADDGPGLARQLLAPIEPRVLLRARLLASGLQALIALLGFLALAAAFGVLRSPDLGLAMLLGGIGVIAPAAPVANGFATVLPRPIRAGSIASSPHPLAELLLPAVIAALAGSAIVAALVSRKLGLGLSLGAAAWMLPAAGLARILETSAQLTFEARRESLLLALEGR